MKGDYFGYDGPCPPWNDSIPHHYVFTLFALDVEKCPVKRKFTAAEVLKSMKGHVLGTARSPACTRSTPTSRSDRLAEAAALAGIAFLGALVFGITGFGAALITIPLATHLVPLKFALALFVLADLAAALSIGFENPKNAVRGEWTRLVPMILVGTALGVTLLVNLPREAGMLLLGLFVLGFGVFTLLPHARRIISPAWAWVAGLAGGITSTVFGAGGPPYAIYLRSAG